MVHLRKATWQKGKFYFYFSITHNDSLEGSVLLPGTKTLNLEVYKIAKKYILKMMMMAFRSIDIVSHSCWGTHSTVYLLSNQHIKHTLETMSQPCRLFCSCCLHRRNFNCPYTGLTRLTCFRTHYKTYMYVFVCIQTLIYVNLYIIIVNI